MVIALPAKQNILASGIIFLPQDLKIRLPAPHRDGALPARGTAFEQIGGLGIIHIDHRNTLRTQNPIEQACFSGKIGVKRGMII